MASRFGQKPEHALQRALDYLSDGKKEYALETLHDLLKRRRQQWSKVYEEVISKHLELCVQLKKPHKAKEALWQYKSLVQQVNVKSLEDVVSGFLSLAEAKTEEARLESAEKAEEIQDDLDQAEASPENILMSAVSGAATQDRTDRAVLSPWLRFLWDSYRNCLELLRNYQQVEHLYHKIARQGYEFCRKYQRRAEFRKLCDHLRIHLNQIQKQQHYSHGVKLTNPESLALMQETRLIQLDTAIQMEMWQEAFKSAEDVHNMMELSRVKDQRMVKPSSYAAYYDKLALIFWKAGSRLYHAAALLQMFLVYKNMKKSWSQEEEHHQATRVILATLSVAAGASSPSDLARHLDMEEVWGVNQRVLAGLLRLPSTPTRAGIVREIVRLNLPAVAHPLAVSLLRHLEQDVNPLRLAQNVQRDLEALEAVEGRPEYAQYIDALRDCGTVTALQQLSQVYDTVSLKRLQHILPYYDKAKLERFLVDSGKKGFLQVNVDHRASCASFGGGTSHDGKHGSNTGVGGGGSEQRLRRQLVVVHASLRDAFWALNGSDVEKTLTATLKHRLDAYHSSAEADHNRILERRKRIETYKELTERQRDAQLRAEQVAAADKERARKADEQAALRRQQVEYEKQAEKARQQAVRDEIAKGKVDQLRKSKIGQMVIEEVGEENLADMQPEQLIQEQVQKMDKQKKDQMNKMKTVEKKYDHLIRAMHEEDIQLKATEFVKLREAMEEHWNETEQTRVDAVMKDHDTKVEMWSRLEPRLDSIRADSEKFKEEVRRSRKKEFDDRVAAWRRRLNAERQKRLEERKKDYIRKERLRRKEEAEAKARQDEDDKRREEDAAKQAARRQAQGLPPARGGPAGKRGFGGEGGEDEMLLNSAADSSDNWRRDAAPRRSEPVGREETPMQRSHSPAAAGAPMPAAADTTSDWRSGGRQAAQAAPPLRQRSRSPPHATAADEESDWRSERRPGPPPPHDQQRSRSPMASGPRMPAQAAPSDEATSWRRQEPEGGQQRPPAAIGPGGMRTEADGGTTGYRPAARLPPAAASTDDQGGGVWQRGAKPTARYEAVEATNPLFDRVQQQQQSDSPWQRGAPRTGGISRPPPPAVEADTASSWRNQGRQPPQSGQDGGEADWRGPVRGGPPAPDGDREYYSRGQNYGGYQQDRDRYAGNDRDQRDYAARGPPQQQRRYYEEQPERAPDGGYAPMHDDRTLEPTAAPTEEGDDGEWQQVERPHQHRRDAQQPANKGEPQRYRPPRGPTTPYEQDTGYNRDTSYRGGAPARDVDYDRRDRRDFGDSPAYDRQAPPAGGQGPFGDRRRGGGGGGAWGTDRRGGPAQRGDRQQSDADWRAKK